MITVGPQWSRKLSGAILLLFSKILRLDFREDAVGANGFRAGVASPVRTSSREKDAHEVTGTRLRRRTASVGISRGVSLLSSLVTVAKVTKTEKGRDERRVRAEDRVRERERERARAT